MSNTEKVKYQFDGEFIDSSWTELPSPEEIKESVTRAITEANTNVFQIRVSRVDITMLGKPIPAFIPARPIVANVVVSWEA